MYGADFDSQVYQSPKLSISTERIDNYQDAPPELVAIFSKYAQDGLVRLTDLYNVVEEYRMQGQLTLPENNQQLLAEVIEKLITDGREENYSLSQVDSFMKSLTMGEVVIKPNPVEEVYSNFSTPSPARQTVTSASVGSKPSAKREALMRKQAEQKRREEEENNSFHTSNYNTPHHSFMDDDDDVLLVTKALGAPKEVTRKSQSFNS